MDFSLNLPINSVSFGQVSTAILREIYKKGLQPCIFPIGDRVDLSTQEEDADFASWVNSGVAKSFNSHSRSNPIFKLWHINGSMESFSEKQILYTFYELDQPTPTEINIVKNNATVIFSSNESASSFNTYGASNTAMIPLGFDSVNFERKDKKYFNDDRITFNLVGKFEKRKHHQKVIQTWVKRFAGNKKYFLQCAIYNNFISQEDNQKITNSVMQGQKPFNVNFFGFMSKNSLYNDFLNSGDIILSMSGGEGWGLPEFHSVAMGKHAVVLNASGYKSWANETNSVLVNPNGKTPAYDGMFFHEGQPFNQGNIYDFDPDEFVHACEEAIKRVEENKVNEAGLSLQNDFTYENTTNLILEEIKKVQ